MPVPPKAIFLSYARDDAAAARRIAEALRSSGLEVWFDESELRGGEAWDAKIRKQIDDCTLFVAVISQHTQERSKGYFRLEWKLAVDQTHLLAEGVPFITPVVIDDTREAGAVVPPEFLRVQWTRLPGALPTPQFVEQVKRLLDAPRISTGGGTAARSDGARTEGGEAALLPPRRRYAVAVASSAIAVAAIGVVATLIATRPSEPAPRRSASPASEKAAPFSEARQLVAKARALYEPWDLATREDFALAEQLLKKAVELDPSDGEAWAVYAILSCGDVVLSYDNSDERKSAARKQAERAFKLAPDSNTARFARAFSLRFHRQTQDECVRLLREEAARQPTNRMVVRTLGSTLRNLGQLEQSLIYFDKAAAIPGSDPITQYNRALTFDRLGRFVEAEAAIDEALALEPSYRQAHTIKIRLLMDYHGDLPRARAQLSKVPPTFFADGSSALLVAGFWLFSRDTVKCLEALRGVSDFQNGTPTAYITGMAQRLVPNIDAARTDWRAALRIVEQRLAAQPNASTLLWWKAVLLAALGERATVEPLLRVLRQRVSTGDESVSEFGVARVLVLMEKPDEALGSLESALKSRSVETLRHAAAYTNSLRYDPVWDPLRGNPRFEALLKVPEQKK